MITDQHYEASPHIFRNAKALRKKGTSAEELFWKIIRNRQIMGFKFRRQHPLKYFVADFYCHEAKLVVELDGNIHELENIKEYDQQREAIIAELGITILRFTNDEIFSEVQNTINKIETYLKNSNPNSITKS